MSIDNLKQLSVDMQSLQHKLILADKEKHKTNLHQLSDRMNMLNDKLLTAHNNHIRSKMNSTLERDELILSAVPTKRSKITTDIQTSYKQSLKQARTFLNNGDSETALTILGFNISSDENDNITILNGYSPIISDGTKTFRDFKIDENKLLENVVKIEGNAVFQDDFKPDHYIETDNLSTVQKSSNNADRIKREFFKQSPEFKQASRDNDIYALLQMSGYDVEKDENGFVTFNGYLNLGYHENKKYGYTSFEELGINNEQLINGINKINGDLVIVSPNTELTLNPNMEITGNVLCPANKRKKLLKGFLSIDEVLDLHKNLTPQMLSSMAETGILKHLNVKEKCQNSSKNNNLTTYYFSENEINKKLSEDIIDYTLKAQAVNEALKNEDDLTAFHILGYDVTSDFETDEITVNGNYIPYFSINKEHVDENSIVTYESLGINQNELLKNVVKITGTALFNNNFTPDHYIEIQQEELSDVIEPISINTDNSTEILKSNLQFQEAVKNNDTFTILQMCGYDVEKDKDGLIIFNGDLNFCQHENDKFDYISFKELGLDEQNIIDGIDKIKGNLIISKNSSIQKLKTDLEVTGTVIHPFEKEGIFSDFYTAEDIVSEYNENGINATPEILTYNRTITLPYEEDGFDEFDKILAPEGKKIKLTPQLLNILDDEGYLHSIQSSLATPFGIKPSLRYFPYEGQNKDFLTNIDFHERTDKRVANILRIGENSQNHIILEENPEESPEIAKKTYKVPFLTTERFPNSSVWSSFVSTAAWYFSPKTRAVMKQVANYSEFKNVLERNKEINRLYKDLALGKIDPKFAKEKIQAIDLSDDDKITLKKYFKTCWTIAGTEEYKHGRLKARDLSKTYNLFGVEKIEDEGLRNRIIKWEQESRPAFL